MGPASEFPYTLRAICRTGRIWLFTMHSFTSCYPCDMEVIRAEQLKEDMVGYGQMPEISWHRLRNAQPVQRIEPLE